MVAYAVELDLGPLLEPRLDGHLEHLIRLHALARLVKRLALDLHLLGDAVEELLQRQRQRPFDGRDFGRRLAFARVGKARRPHARTPSTRGAAGAGCTAKGRENAGKVVFFVAASRPTDPALAHKLRENVLGVVEAICLSPPGAATPAGAEVICAGAAKARLTGAAKVKPGKVAGHAAGSEEGIPAGIGALGRRSAPSAEQDLEAVLVVDLALLGVRQDLVGFGAFLELFGRVGVVLVLVGMPFQCGFSEKKPPSARPRPGQKSLRVGRRVPVTFFNLVLRGVGLDAKRVVELGFFYHGEQLVNPARDRLEYVCVAANETCGDKAAATSTKLTSDKKAGQRRGRETERNGRREEQRPRGRKRSRCRFAQTTKDSCGCVANSESESRESRA